MRPLDPTWWRRVATGYEQQDGAGRIYRLKSGSKVTGWSLYVQGEYKGQWPTLGQTKRRAYQITGGVAPL